jgi:hypothetical protein
MTGLPEEDKAPLEPPTTLIALSRESAASGMQVIVMPCVNPMLSPLLQLSGIRGKGWYIRVVDAFGTIVWSIMLEGIEAPQ